MNRQMLAFQVLDENMEPVSATYASAFVQTSTGEWRNMNPLQVPLRGEPYLVRAHDERELEMYWSEPLARSMKDEEPRGLALFAQGALALRMRI